MKAFITGITGQDGSYMADLLLSKGYEVHGLIRRSTHPNLTNFVHILNKITIHYGDCTDASRMQELVGTIQPDELYHFACLSHVKNSFTEPLFSSETIIDGTLHLLEAIRQRSPQTKFYYAGSSEMFGNSYPAFKPASPYGAAKLYGYHISGLYRDSYGLNIYRGVLFNHESPRRGENFVTRKITKGIARIVSGDPEPLYLGNLGARRDWGYAPEFVEYIFNSMRYNDPLTIDFELGTGETHSVEEFVDEAFKHVGLRWIDHVQFKDNLKRPNEIHVLKCEHSSFKLTTKFKDLVKIMVDAEVQGLTKQK